MYYQDEIYKRSPVETPDLQALSCRGIGEGEEHLCELWNSRNEYMGYIGELDVFEFSSPDTARLDEDKIAEGAIELVWNNGVECVKEYTHSKSILNCKPKE